MWSEWWVAMVRLPQVPKGQGVGHGQSLQPYQSGYMSQKFLKGIDPDFPHIWAVFHTISLIYQELTPYIC
jgi:hypothetical protein